MHAPQRGAITLDAHRNAAMGCEPGGKFRARSSEPSKIW